MQDAHVLLQVEIPFGFDPTLTRQPLLEFRFV